MLGSAVIGGFILAMIEGTGILINRYSQMFMPAPTPEGINICLVLNTVCNEYYFLEGPIDLDKGKVDLSAPTFFNSPSGPSSSAPSHFS